MKKVITYLFLISALDGFGQNILQMEYYMNTDPGFGNGTAITGFAAATNVSSFNVNLNVASAPKGMNIAYVRAKDANGIWSISAKIPFIKTSLSKMKRAEYYFNTDPGFGNALAITMPSTMDINDYSVTLNISSAPPGLNTLCIRTQDSLGGWSLTNVYNFIRQRGTLPQNMQAVEYFIDSDPGFGMGMQATLSSLPDVSNFSFDADLTGIDTGAHTIFIRTKDAFGSWSLTSAVSFNKTPSTIGIIEVREIHLNVYPNPSTDKFTFESTEFTDIVKTEVIDAKGMVIYSNNTHSEKQVFDLSEKNSGNYFLRVYKKDGSIIYQRLIKQ